MLLQSALGTTPALAAAKQQLRQQMKQRLASLPADAVAEQSAAVFRALVRFPPFVDARRVAVFLSMPAAEVQTDAIVRHALAAGKQVFVPYLHKPGPNLLRAGTETGTGTDSTNPYVPPRVMDMVQLHDAADYEALARDRWGIPSVAPSSVHTRCRVLGDGDESGSGSGSGSASASSPAAPLSLDLILLPGVAFDVDPATRRVHRCGHGRGFYDYFLQRYALKMAASSLSEPSSSSPLRPIQLYGLALTEQLLPAHSVPTDPHDQPLDGLITGDGTVVIPELESQT
ncbi:5-formyltetrahydrofolate cyclo-ligase [Niveomyces insectorum RCEF 264]|uniref:5-formyltetrahydrofolate cyclo-ligase n=1 Tax=Niveomyces insectorum RCEF 264 TaxID=1081102 RepID=A0A167PR30_9HYPO|nr:5-formyltetrahydrofolate cyclo-ligase [Niveomyces insectorum RCEF 264]